MQCLLLFFSSLRFIVLWGKKKKVNFQKKKKILRVQCTIKQLFQISTFENLTWPFRCKWKRCGYQLLKNWILIEEFHHDRKTKRKLINNNRKIEKPNFQFFWIKDNMSLVWSILNVQFGTAWWSDSIEPILKVEKPNCVKKNSLMTYLIPVKYFRGQNAFFL